MRLPWRRSALTPAEAAELARPVRLQLEDWPASAITVNHRHTYAERPAPAKIRVHTVQIWLEDSQTACPITARMSCPVNGSNHIPLGRYWDLLDIKDRHGDGVILRFDFQW
jgi:hypothetical protein